MNNDKNILKSGAMAVFAVLLITILVVLPFLDRWDSGLETSIPAEEPVGVIDFETVVVQEVYTNVAVVKTFSLSFATYQRENDCTVIVQILSGRGDLLQEWRLDGRDLRDNTYVDFDLTTPYEGSAFFIRVSSDADPGSAVTLWRSDSKVYADNRLTVNDEEVDGTLCFKVNGKFSVSHVKTLRIYNLIIAGLFAALLLCVYLTAFVFKNIERRFGLVLLLAGLIYLLTMTPHSIPDEERHTNLSELLSNTLLFNSDLALIPADAYDSRDYDGNLLSDERHTKDGYTFKYHGQAVDGYIAIVESLFIENPVKQDKPLAPPFLDIYMFFCDYPVMYLPQALGISVARLLYVNPLQVYLMGRLFNLLFYALITGYAVKIIPKRFRTLLMLLALMPMSLHQAGSYSYDVFSNALSFLLAAYLLRLAFDSERVRLRDFILVLAVGCLLAPARMVYAPIALLVFLIPKEKYPSPRHYRLWSGLTAGLPLLLAALYMAMFGSSLVMNTGSILNAEESTVYTVTYALQHPIQTAGVYLNTLIDHTEPYITSFVGMRLSGLSLPIHFLPITAYLFVLFLGIFDTETDEGAALTMGNRVLIWTVGAVVYVLVLAGLLFACTGITSRAIEGVQGRYFIPIALPVLATASGLLRYRRDISRWLILLSILINASIINHIIAVTSIL